MGVAYSEMLTATGGLTPYTWKITSGHLPGGLSLSSGGVISGTPTTVESAAFTVQVRDSQTIRHGQRAAEHHGHGSIAVHLGYSARGRN